MPPRPRSSNAQRGHRLASACPMQQWLRLAAWAAGASPFFHPPPAAGTRGSDGSVPFGPISHFMHILKSTSSCHEALPLADGLTRKRWQWQWLPHSVAHTSTSGPMPSNLVKIHSLTSPCSVAIFWPTAGSIPSVLASRTKGSDSGNCGAE